ncbi:MAG: HAMP domain-containing sensor histidine kinase [Acidobacteriota bacterium]
MAQQSDLRNFRWDVLLPSAAAVVAALLIGLASLAGYAFKQREAFALDGRVLGLAHRIESQLRETDPGAEQELLESLRQELRRPILGLCLRDGEGRSMAEVGETDPALSPRSIDLFVAPMGGARGRPWTTDSQRTPGQPRGRRGRRTLEVFLSPGAAAPPLPIRLLLPSSVAVGLGLVALAVLGGRLLIRQRYEAEVEADRRRLESLGRAGAGLAHQLKNPLATIKGSAQLLGERIEEKDPRDRAQAIVAQADRMDRMLGALLDFARPPAPEVTTVNLDQNLSALVRDMPLVRCDIPGSVETRVDPDHLHHIVENLLSNALSHSPEDSAVEISAHKAGDTVEIQISDRGPGPGDDPEELFQPYVTHRPDGAGLGLTIARTLAEANGGSLMLGHRDGGGTTAVLKLPAGDTDQ